MRMRTPILLATIGTLALAGCDNPNFSQNFEGPNGHAKTGALTGATLGALAGAASGGTNRLGKAAIGGVIGAAVGGLVGGALDQQARELRGDMGNDNVTVTNTGNELVVNMPQDVLFDTDSTIIRPDLQHNLGAVAHSLIRYPDSTVRVIGNTDNTGTAAHNQDLSQRRADAVAAVLEDDGVRPARIIAVGRGESQPVATNLTAEGRAQNRRVEIHIQPTNN